MWELTFLLLECSRTQTRAIGLQEEKKNLIKKQTKKVPHGAGLQPAAWHLEGATAGVLGVNHLTAEATEH